MTVFALCVRQLKGDTNPPVAFIFEAVDEGQAVGCAQDWSRRQGFCYREDVLLREATKNEAESMIPHNEYL
jgi:hypothetical protein